MFYVVPAFLCLDRREVIFVKWDPNTEAYREVEGVFSADKKSFYFIESGGKYKPYVFAVLEYKNKN